MIEVSRDEPQETVINIQERGGGGRLVVILKSPAERSCGHGLGPYIIPLNWYKH